LLYVESTTAETTTHVYGGGNNSTQTQDKTHEFVVSGGGDTLDHILGPLSFHGQTTAGGYSIVALNDARAIQNALIAGTWQDGLPLPVPATRSRWAVT
jgi:hypothetical protein